MVSVRSVYGQNWVTFLLMNPAHVWSVQGQYMVRKLLKFACMVGLGSVYGQIL